MIYTFYASKLMAYTDMTKYKLSRMTLEERIKFVNPYFNKAQVVQHVEDLLEAIVQTEFGVARIPKVLDIYSYVFQHCELMSRYAKFRKMVYTKISSQLMEGDLEFQNKLLKYIVVMRFLQDRPDFEPGTGCDEFRMCWFCHERATINEDENRWACSDCYNENENEDNDISHSCKKNLNFLPCNSPVRWTGARRSTAALWGLHWARYGPPPRCLF